MAPPCAALAQSESKARFFERLGLRDDDQNHRSIYTMMKEEAVEGRRRLTEDKEALLPELRNTGLEPPYSHAHVTETAIHREILRIYQRARPETRQVYDLGRDLERVEEENWVIRWMLWHVFRYRDNRNRNRKGLGSNANSPDHDDYGDDDSSPAPSATRNTPTTPVTRGPSRYWDPVRNR
ncbi:hypothetical protein D0868_16848 [Hortaea werneckii]|uniref:Uncharacterized protein n=1 Tax=Hortaea werneckii TaxID=91943 RepID=A0A3M6WA00_HORWE|nr:hypothetical protein D0868_16848 [Hortaea werneckii]